MIPDAPTAEAPSPLLLDVHEAAGALAVSERTLARLTAAGEVPVVRIGRRVLYDRQDLRRFVSSRKGGGHD